MKPLQTKTPPELYLSKAEKILRLKEELWLIEAKFHKKQSKILKKIKQLLEDQQHK